MSGQAKRVLDERIVQESIKDAEEEDYGVFDEVEEKSPEDYIELEKTTSVAVNQFIDGEIKWRRKEDRVEKILKKLITSLQMNTKPLS